MATTRIHNAYNWMHRRTKDTKYDYYHLYWWKWIKVCERRSWINWLKNFIEDMWEPPIWKSLDRIDNSKDYCIDNCRRASKTEQACNRSTSTKRPWVSFDKSKNMRYSIMYFNNEYVLRKRYKKYEDAVYHREQAELKYLWFIIKKW